MSYPLRDTITSLVDVCEKIIQQASVRQRRPADSVIKHLRAYNKGVINKFDDDVAEFLTEDIKEMLSHHRHEIINPQFDPVITTITLHWNAKDITNRTPRVAISSFYRAARAINSPLAMELLLYFYRLIREYMVPADQLVLDARINQLAVKLGLIAPAGASGLGQLLQGNNMKDVINNIASNPSAIKDAIKSITNNVDKESLRTIGQVAKEMMNDSGLKSVFSTLTEEVKDLTGVLEENKKDDPLPVNTDEPQPDHQE